MARDLSREAAERLLSGASATPPPDGDRLAALLAAASAPAEPHELAGEQEALAAFRALPPPTAGRRIRRGFATKLAAVVAATVAAGGVAVASAAGVIPNPFEAPAGPSPSAPPGPSSAGSAEPSPSAGVSPAERSPDAATAAALPGLCHAWQAKAPGERGNVLQTPAFSSLVTAAGGAANVGGYCADLLETTGAKPSAPATPAPKRTSPPSKSPKAPRAHPTPAR